MNADTLTTITDELTAAGWHSIDRRERDPLAPIVNALQRRRMRTDARTVRTVFDALEGRRPKPADLPDDLGLPVPTVEELADEAAWWVDTFFMRALAFEPDRPWVFTNEDVACEALPADVRRTCHRAGMTVAAAHGCPDQAPTMRQVANALIRRMYRDGRIQR